MKIAVIGPGGIGCLFAALLAEAGHDVCIVDRRPERAALIAREGLIIESNGRLRTIAIRASAFPSDVGPPRRIDLIILCVKAHETAGITQSILTLSLPNTAVLSLQNGLGNMEALENIVKGANLFAGITTYGATVAGLNLVRHAGAGPTFVGSLHQNNAGAETLAAMLTKAGIETAATQNTPGMLWGKLIINAAICPVSVMADLPNGELAENQKWRALMEKAAQEGATVAAAKGIMLIFPDPVKAVLDVCRNTAPNVSSMLQDIRRGRQTEITAINGVIVRHAAELGIDAPVNAMLYEKVVELERRREYK